jgi:CBS domain-containing protein
MKISQILTANPEVISPDARICEAARIMREGDIGMLPVCDGERLVGSITES